MNLKHSVHLTSSFFIKKKSLCVCKSIIIISSICIKRDTARLWAFFNWIWTIWNNICLLHWHLPFRSAQRVTYYHLSQHDTLQYFAFVHVWCTSMKSENETPRSCTFDKTDTPRFAYFNEWQFIWALKSRYAAKSR